MTPDLLEEAVLALLLVVTRVGATLAMMPLFGDRQLPRMVKVGLVVSLSVFWFCELVYEPMDGVARMTVKGHWIAYGVLVGREAVLGAVIGYVFGLILLPARIAGSYIGQEMGLTMATITDTTTQTQTNIMGTLFESLAFLLFFSMDIHHLLLGTLHASFAKWPIGTSHYFLPIDTLSSSVAQANQWGLQIAGPAACCLFVTVFVLALTMKMTPQFNLFSIGATVRLIVGLVATLAFLPEMMVILQRVLNHAVNLVYL